MNSVQRKSVTSTINTATLTKVGVDPFMLDVRAMSAVDLNGDGYLDIFLHPSYVTSGNGLAPVLLLNDGHGGFADATQNMFKYVPTLNQTNGVFFSDFNGDGRVDMFVVDQGLEIGGAANYTGAQNRLFLQDAKGVFQDATSTLPNNDASFNHVSTMADINGDGVMDMIITRLGGPKLEGAGTFMYLSDGHGGFTSSTEGLPEEIKYMVANQRDWGSTNIDYQNTGSNGVGDLNNDDHADLITGSYTTGDQVTNQQTVRVFQQDTTGQFAMKWEGLQPSDMLKAVGVMGVAGITTGDIDGDGLADIVVRWESGSKDAVEVLKNMGNFQFQDITKSALGSYLVRTPDRDSTGDYAQQNMLTKLVDVNHDGSLDIVLTNMDATAAQVVNGVSTGAFLYLNDSKGHFAPWQPVDTSGHVLTAAQFADALGSDAWSLGAPMVFDTNNDGKNDYVFVNGVMNQTTNTVSSLKVSTLVGDTTNGTYLVGGTNTVVGSSGNDTFVGVSGAANGGNGLDTLVLSGIKADYVISHTAAGFVVDNATNHTEVSIANIERLQFADTNVALDVSGNGGQIFRLYQAAFDRAPDVGGLGFWMHGADSGVSMNDIATGFTHSDEFAKLYGAHVSDADYVTHLYNNVLHRAPEQGGFDFWMGALKTGVSHETLLLNFAESAENVAALVGVTQNGVQYTAFYG